MEIKYLGKTNNVLEHNKIYKVYRVLQEGVQVYIDTGFCGIEFKYYKEEKENK